MQRRIATYRSPKQRHWLSGLIVALGIISLYTIGGASVTYADGTPGGNIADPVVRAVDVAKPAVVRIITTINGHLAVHFSSAQSATFPQGGNGYPLILSGSGTFISAHGDILTADHVVNPPKDQSLSQFLDTQAAADVASYINQNFKPNPSVTENQVAQELTNGQLSSTPNYDTPTSEAFLSTDFTGPLSAANFQDIPPAIHATVDRIEQQSSFNEKDVAIVHVNMNDMASVQLGDSSSVQQQDKLTIIGFPGNGDISNTPTNLFTSSINEVFVSSIKTTDQGAQLIQVGGNVEHGDSGGPALDSNGTVVGIVSFGLSSPDSPGSTAFLQASNSAKVLVQNLHLDTTPGPFQRAWNQALSDYATNTSGHWHKTQQELGQLAKNYPLFQAIKPYLTYAQAQAQKEPAPQSQSTQAQGNGIITLVLIILGLVVVSVLVVLVVVMQRRGKRRAGTPATIPPFQSAPPATFPRHGQNHATLPPQGTQADGMAAFGAPPSTTLHPGQTIDTPVATAGASNKLQAWPCGHMNRPNARYCIICGEPSPPTTIRRMEQ